MVPKGSSVRAGEPPLIAFVSSVMDDELQPARDCLTAVIGVADYLLPWLFEYTPASSQDVQTSYLEKVSRAALVFWLVGDRTTEAVVAEINEALSTHRRLIVLVLPAKDKDERDATTTELLAKVRPKAKYCEVADLDDLAAQAKLAISDEINRALQDQPGMSRVARLDELGRASRSRCVERWEVAGVETTLALTLAHDMSIGEAPVATMPTADRPVRVLQADLGAGKSLAGERFHQAAIAKQLTDATAPVPVYVRARDAAAGLAEAAVAASDGLGDPRQQGADIVLDGIDESGVGVAAELFRQARELARTWPATRILVTSRPLSILTEAEELAILPPLERSAANDLVGRFAGFEITPGREGGWPQNLRDAIRLPLFAVLLGAYFRRSGEHMPGSRGELLRSLVEDGIGRVGEEVRPLLHRLAIASLSRRGGPAPEAEVVSQPSEVAQLEDTRLVVARDRTLVFPLVVIAQWFAAESLAQDASFVRNIVEAPEQREEWRYPLAIVAGTYSFEQVTGILGPLAAAHPGFASQVIEEGLAKWSNAEDVLPPSARECGKQIRRATEKWIEGLGPLRPELAPLDASGALRPLGVHVNDHWLTTGWYVGPDSLPDVTDLPQGIWGFLAGGGDPSLHVWTGVHGARPGRQAAWAWRWSFEQHRGVLKEKLKRRELSLPAGPLAESRLWAMACTLKALSFVHSEPIPIQPLYDGIPQEADVLITPQGRINSRDLADALRERLGRGESTLSPPFPPPDRPFAGGWVWSPWSDQRLLERTTEVYKTALRGYEHLTKTLFASLAPWMQTAVTLPARLNGYLQPTQHEAGYAGAPTMQWWLEALPTTEKSDVAIQLDPERGEHWSPANGQQILERTRALRPAQSQWLDLTMHNSILHVFEPWAAEELVYGWLWKDLERISWVDGMIGERPSVGNVL